MKVDDGKTIPLPSSHIESIPSAITSKSEDSKQPIQINGGSSSPSLPTNLPDKLNSDVNKAAKSCKGCLYYSSRFKADSKNPICVGLTRSLPNAPQYTAGELETEAYKAGRNLQDFRYGCVGYSVFADRKEQGEVEQDKLPWCLGIEVIEDRRVNNNDPRSAPMAHIHNREEGNGLPKHGPIKPTNSAGDDYLCRFTLCANLVAKGVTLMKFFIPTEDDQSKLMQSVRYKGLRRLSSYSDDCMLTIRLLFHIFFLLLLLQSFFPNKGLDAPATNVLV